MLYLDFVPNHSAVDATLVTTHPEYYIKEDIVKDSKRQYKNGMYYGWIGGGDGWTDTL